MLRFVASVIAVLLAGGIAAAVDRVDTDTGDADDVVRPAVLTPVGLGGKLLGRPPAEKVTETRPNA